MWSAIAPKCLTKKETNMPMETVILEKTIIKLGTLLALGFGQAGTQIIAQNMASSSSAGVNAMVGGQRVECIFGVAKITNFAIATEVLQTKVMTFVNQIAEIVHGVVDEFHGAPNKNNGADFLLIWRTHSATSSKEQRKMVDMSMLAFTKIVGVINRSPTLADYRYHPGLQQRHFGRVCLTFGLHCGWAIEGAIGSEFKIDASYLSPNVNMASRIEAATKQFDISILISHWLIELCTK